MAEAKKAAASAKAKVEEEDDAIIEQKDGKFTFACPLNVFGLPLSSSGASPCGFVSADWPDEDSAVKRGQEHVNEHVTGEPMSNVPDFIAANQIEG